MATTAKNNNFKYLLSLAVIKKLWVRGYITEEEMRRIDARNKISFGYTEPTETEQKGA